MGGWGDVLGGLRDEFVGGSLRRLARMRELLAALRADPGDSARRHELMLLFHGLAGAGTTYGFPDVTRLGLTGERLTSVEGVPVPADALLELDPIVEDMERALRAGGIAPIDLPAGAALDTQLRPQVLLVEDDAEFRALLRQRLEQEGYRVAEAGSRAEALASLGAQLPDAVVCDEILPDGTGDEVAASLRAMPGGAGVKILMASVRAGFMGKLEALTSGADAYFEKPVNWEALLRRLQHLLELRREPPRVLCVLGVDEQGPRTRQVLSSAGYALMALDRPPQFEDALASFRPDLVLVDAALPETSGYDITRYVRQHARFGPLPVLMLAGEGSLEGRIKGLRAGCDEYLVKPVDPSLLLASVAAHLERSRLAKSMMEREGLTRLLTRSAFLERIREAYERARRRPELSPLLLMLDLDHFKSVNDRHGHATGDRVLVAFSTLLRRQLRHSDVVGRYGGEEFAILVDASEERGALVLANRLRESLAALPHAAPDGTTFKVTLSIGLAWLDTRSLGLDDWLRAADEALYVCKAQGRNRSMIASNARPRGQGPPAGS